MSTLDFEALLQFNVELKKQIDILDRRKRNLPLFEAMKTQMKQLQEGILPNLLAGPNRAVEEATLNLEKSTSSSNDLEREVREHFERSLAASRRRTAALRAWLEAVS